MLSKLGLQEKIKSLRFVKFINKRKYISGVCFTLFWIFSEPIPLGTKIGEIFPEALSINYFLAPFPFLKDFPMAYLLAPALILFFIAILPILERDFRLLYSIIIAAGFLFYPLIYLFKASYYAPLLWCILFAHYAGINLWIRSLDYFYSFTISMVFMDLGAAVLAFFRGIPEIGVPYHPRLPTTLVVLIDMALIVIFSLLWWRRVDAAKKYRWLPRWLESYE